jgi:hypothetical protein
MKPGIIADIECLLAMMHPVTPSSITLYPSDHRAYINEAMRQKRLSGHESHIQPETYKGIPVRPLYGDLQVVTHG